MPMLSYAQNQEDVLLARVFPEPTGFYIDVGAAHPVGHSVTKHFYDRGWSGINVEPQPTFFKMIVEDRPRDVNVNAAVSDAAGEVVFYEVPGSLGESTLNPVHGEALRGSTAVVNYTVKTVTLRDLCEKHVGDRTIDFLKVDAEQHELTVLQSGDYRRWRPRVILVETSSYLSWDRFVLAQGYVFAFYDGLNRYYVRAEEDPRFIRRLAVPANCLDDYRVFEYEQRIRELEHQLAVATRAA